VLETDRRRVGVIGLDENPRSRAALERRSAGAGRDGRRWRSRRGRPQARSRTLGGSARAARRLSSGGPTGRGIGHALDTARARWCGRGRAEVDLTRGHNFGA
jgi:hypothetical protein